MRRLTFVHGPLSHWQNFVSALVFAMGLLAGAPSTLAQSDPNYRDLEPQVSLSAAAISQILRQEPGLLLEVKKLMVREAYEQGRLLDPADLTDEALYRLLREDENTRFLATREIERREYIRPKPTREEVERKSIQRLPGAGTNGGGATTSPAADAGSLRFNDEEKYWAQHEELPAQNQRPARGRLGNNGPAGAGADGGFVGPETVSPADNLGPGPAEPASPAGNYGRRQSLAGVEPQNRDTYDGAPADAGLLPRAGPEDMPGLLSASLNEARPSPAQPFGPLQPFDGRSGVTSSWAGRADRGAGTSSFPAGMEGSQPALPDQERPPIRHRVNPYADVPSLYDLYVQVSKDPPALHRFGEEVFRNGTGNFDELPMDTPVGPDYVLGPGDGLNIELWGAVSQRLERMVDREGRVALPEAGAIEVTGHTLGEVQQTVQKVLRGEFRDVHADVSLGRLRTVRVYVVGDVVRPGAYDVSSLSTPLNALYQAGGPTARGSMRTLRVYRGPQLVSEIDLYDLLLHGVRSTLQRLRPGDTIMTPPLGAELTVEGMVRRPAIYELNREGDLAQALALAGGVLNTGTLRHIEVERVVAHQGRSMLQFDLPEDNNEEAANRELEEFKIQDGDKIRVWPILAASQQTVYLDGHVFRPGKRAYREGMRVSDLIHSYTDLLPEPDPCHAEIIRLTPPDFAPQVIAFNLQEALAVGAGGAEPEKTSAQNVTLKPFDTVRIFSRFDFEDPPEIAITGEVRHPGEHVTNGETRLRDAVYLAGGVTRDALLSDAQIFRRTSGGKLKVLSVNLERALAGDPSDNIQLAPKDRVFIHRSLVKVDPATVKIEGEVARPGKYPLGEGMSAAQLVRLAGGLTRGAFGEAADLTRYPVENGTQVMGEHVAIPIARALAGEADTDVRLHDGDVLTIRQLAGWNDVGAVIAVKGEVMHPGDYGIQEGERLSSILRRAGGFRADAYPYGAILERGQVRELEEKNRADLIRRVREQQASFKLIPDAGDTQEKLAKDAALEQWHATLDDLESTPPGGRLVIHISTSVAKWANTAADVEVRAGDTLLIPKAPAYVVVNGQVYNPTAISYRPGKNAGWYLRQAGGPTAMANKKAIFVVRGDGSVIGGKGGGEWFTGDVLSAELRPGDMVFVPDKALGGSPVWKNTLQAAQLMSTVAIAVSVGHGF